LRRVSGLNQTEFWAKVGISQNTGLRYESRGSVPPTVGLLIDLVYVRLIDVAKLNGEDMAILEYLQLSLPGWYARLRKIVKSARGKRK